MRDIYGLLNWQSRRRLGPQSQCIALIALFEENNSLQDGAAGRAEAIFGILDINGMLIITNAKRTNQRSEFIWGTEQSSPILLSPREILQVKIFTPGDGAISEGEFLKGCLEDADLVRCCSFMLILFYWIAGSRFCGLVSEIDNTQIMTLFYYLRWETSRTNKKQEMIDQNFVSLFYPT